MLEVSEVKEHKLFDFVLVEAKAVLVLCQAPYNKVKVGQTVRYEWGYDFNEGIVVNRCSLCTSCDKVIDLILTLARTSLEDVPKVTQIVELKEVEYEMLW